MDVSTFVNRFRVTSPLALDGLVGLSTQEPTCIKLHQGRNQQFGGERMVLNHFKELLRSWLNSRVGHKHDFYQFGHQVRIADVVLVAQHHNEEHHNILSAGLVEHLRRVSEGEKSTR